MDAAVGAVVLEDRYELRGKLRRGSDCHLYRARDLVEQRDVALTVLPSNDAAGVQRFERDRALLEEADSPVLVPLLAISGPDAPVPYVVSELVEAESLETRLARTALHPELVRSIGLAVAAGLAALHRAGAAHGGVDLANVLVPRIADSRLLAARLKGFVGAASVGSDGDEGMTAAGDVRALGLVLLACLSGAGAGAGTREGFASLAGDGTRPVEPPPGTPAALVDVLDAMTDPEPGRRPTAEDAFLALRELGPLVPRRPAAASMPLGPATAAAPLARTPGRRDRARHRLPWYAVAGTGGAAAAGLVLLAVSASVLQPQGPIQALPRSSAAPSAAEHRMAAAAPGQTSTGTTSAALGGAPSPAAESSPQGAAAQLLEPPATTSSGTTSGDSLVVAPPTGRTGTGDATPIAELTAALATGASGSRTTAPALVAASPSAPSTPTTGRASTRPASPSSSASPRPSSPSSPSSSASSATSTPPTTSSPHPSPAPVTHSPSSPPSPEPSRPSSATTSNPSSTATSDPSPSTSTPSTVPSPSASATRSDPAPSTTDPGPTVSASAAVGGVQVSAP